MDAILDALGDSSHINSRDENGDSPLHLVLYKFYDEWTVVKLLLSLSGAIVYDDNVVDLQNALNFSDIRLKVINLFLDRGALINGNNNLGMFPLHFAVINCDFDVVKLLIDRGAHVNVQNNAGKSPLHFAVSNNRLDVIKLLLDSGADINVSNNHDYSPLYIAVEKMNLNVIKLLLDRDVNVNGSRSAYETPLHKAVANSDCKLEVVKLLLDRKAIIQSVTRLGETPLHWAVANGKCKLEVVELLLDRGAAIDKVTSAGETPLHWTIKYKCSLDIIRLMLNRGATVNLKDDHGEIPLQWAIKFYNDSNNEIFLKYIEVLVKYTLLANVDFNFEADLIGEEDPLLIMRLGNRCKSELSKMVLENIGDNITLRYFVSIPQTKDVQCDLIRIMNILEDNSYPLYSEVISSKVKRQVMLNELERKLVFLKASGSRVVFLDCASVFKVVRYLGQKDLLNFLLAFFDRKVCVHMSDSSYPKQNDCLLKRSQERERDEFTTNVKRSRVNL